GVAVDHHVDVGLDVGEHPAHDVALARYRFAPHDRAGLAGHLRGTVRRSIVVDVDGRTGKMAAKVANDSRDRRLLVVTGHEHGDGYARDETLVEGPRIVGRDPLGAGHR